MTGINKTLQMGLGNMNVYIVDLDLDGSKSFKIVEANTMSEAYHYILGYIGGTGTAYKHVAFKIIEDHGKAFKVI